MPPAKPGSPSIPFFILISVLFTAVLFFISLNLKPDSLNLSVAPNSAPNDPALVVTDFFNLVSSGDYQSAVNLLSLHDSTWDFMDEFNQNNTTNRASILQNYCQVIGTCYQAQPIKTTQVSDTEYQVTVQFIQPDGTVFILGPCCGATEAEMPSQSQFEFTVKKINGQFKLTSPPLYRP